MLNKNRTGLALGWFFVFWHFVWSIVVFLGLGQTFLNWAFEAHYLAGSHDVIGVTILRFLGLMAMAFVGGYVIGWVFSYVWNKFNK